MLYDNVNIDPTKPPVKEDPINAEMKILYKKNMFTDNIPAYNVVLNASKKTGVNPSLLFSSAFQEGMNKAIAKPNEVSEAYNIAGQHGLNQTDFPIDGFYNYGLDTFGDRYNDLKKYLPEGFDKRFQTYSALNEKNEHVNTAAFKTNEDALVAKAAMIRQAEDSVDNYAKEKGITINPADKNYFVLATYNGGEGNAREMIDQYGKAKDKSKFISEGQTTRKGVHQNIMPRLQRMSLVDKLLNSNK